MPLARSADHPTFDLAGNRITGLAAPSSGATEAILYRIDMPPGGSIPLHTHDHQDVFHVLEGSATAEVDGERISLAAGDTAIAPAGTRHPVQAGDGGATLLVTMLAGTLVIRDDGTSGVPGWGV